MKNSEYAGVIYILTNPSFPQYVKIGYAKDVKDRLRQLNRSETIPYAFRVYAEYKVKNKLNDKQLHKLIDGLNQDLRSIEEFDGKTRVREFFEMSAEDAYQILECVAKISGTSDCLHRCTPEGHEISDEQHAEEARESFRRGPFKFSLCNIKVGEEIAFVDDTSKIAEVVDENHVKYGNEVTSLSRLAQDLKGVEHPLQGPCFFMHKGELLVDLRKRLEQE
mgnify:CR=1 FL=1